MNRIITCLILTVICSNNYALLISKGRVLNHKEWSDQGMSNAKISDVNFQQTSSITKSIHHQDIGFSTATNEAIGISNIIHKATVVINQKIIITGGVKTYIENFTNTTHVYTVKSMMCAYANHDCSYTLDTIELAPGGKIQSRKSIELSHTYNKVGTNLTYIATWVKRDESSSLLQTDNVNTVSVIS